MCSLLDNRPGRSFPQYAGPIRSAREEQALAGKCQGLDTGRVVEPAHQPETQLARVRVEEQNSAGAAAHCDLLAVRRKGDGMY